MKKILLPGMLASIAFAACTNEELVPQQTAVPEFDLSSRPVVGQVDLVFGPQTRMGLGTGYNGFEFAATDKLGARLIDEVNTSKLGYANHQFRYKPAANNVAYSNYAYEKQADGSWGTEALLVEGNYMFYAPYNAEARDRSALGVTFPIVQNIDPTSTDKVKTEKGDLDANVDAVQEFFSGENGHTAFIGHYFLDASKDIDGITPAYNHLYAYPVITLTNDYKVSKAGELVGEKITINRVLISSTNIYSNYTVNNEGIMKALRNSAVEYKDNGDVKESQDLGWWRTKDGANAKNFLLNAETTDMLDEVTSGKDVKNGTITVVFNPALEIEAGESFSFHVVMPAAEYAASNLSITPVYTEKENVEWSWNADEFVKDATTYTFAPGMWCPSEEYNVEGSKPAYKATAGSLTEYSIKGAMERYQAPATDLKSLDEFVAWLDKNNFDHSIALEEGASTFTFAKETVKINGEEESYSVIPFDRALMDVVKKYLVTGSIKFTTNMLATGDLIGNYAVDGTKYQFAGGLDQKDGKIALSNATVAGDSRFFGEANLTNVTINGAAVFNGMATLNNVTANSTTFKGAGSVVEGESDLGTAVIEKNTNIKGKAKATALTIKGGATVDYNSEKSCGAITVQENATLNMNKSYAAEITVGAQVDNNKTAGTLNINASQDNAITVKKGNVTIVSEKTVKTLTWTENWGATLTNNGTIKCAITVPNNGTYVHNGSVTGDVKVSKAADSNNAAGIIENKADITVAENNGKIIAKTGSHTTVSAGNGIVSNDVLAYVKANVDQTVYYTFTDEVNVSDLEKFDAFTYDINKLILKGGLVFDKKLSDKNKPLVNGVKTIEFNTADKGISMKANMASFLNVETIEVNAAVPFSGFQKENSRISFANDVTIKVAAKLSVKYLSMVAYEETPNVNIELGAGGSIEVINSDIYVGEAYVPVHTAQNGGIYNGYYGAGVYNKQDLVTVGSEYQVYSLAGLNEVKALITADGFAGKTIKLMNNITMVSAWTPIAFFNGTFDGNGKTIYNLSATAEQGAGFFGNTGGAAVVKNLTIDGATVSGNHWVGAIAGYAYGTITGCTVKNATINCTAKKDGNGNVITDLKGDKAGAVVGYLGEDATLKQCTAANSSVKAVRDAGQIVGAAYETCVTLCSATNVTVSGTGANIKNAIIGRNLSIGE